MMVSAGFVRETTWLTNRNFRSLLTSAARGVGERPSPRTRIPEFTFEAGRQSASLRRMTTGPSQKPCSPRKRSSRRFRQLAQLCDVMVWSQRRPFSHGPREAGCTGYCPHPDPPCKAADALFDIYRPCAASATLLSFREGVRHVANSPEWQCYSWHDLDPILNVINSLGTQQGSIRLSNGCNLVSE